MTGEDEDRTPAPPKGLWQQPKQTKKVPLECYNKQIRLFHLQAQAATWSNLQITWTPIVKPGAIWCCITAACKVGFSWERMDVLWGSAPSGAYLPILQSPKIAIFFTLHLHIVQFSSCKKRGDRARREKRAGWNILPTQRQHWHTPLPNPSCKTICGVMETLPDRAQEAHREWTAGITTMQINEGKVHWKCCLSRGTIMQVYLVAGGQAFTEVSYAMSSFWERNTPNTTVISFSFWQN